MSDDKRRPTIAALLDETSWDYSPEKDRKVLLNSVGRLLAGVSWEFNPQHLGIAGSRTRIAVHRQKRDASYDTRPNPRLDRPGLRDSE
jgi:hypothetical protein